MVEAGLFIASDLVTTSRKEYTIASACLESFGTRSSSARWLLAIDKGGGATGWLVDCVNMEAVAEPTSTAAELLSCLAATQAYHA